MTKDGVNTDLHQWATKLAMQVWDEPILDDLSMQFTKIEDGTTLNVGRSRAVIAEVVADTIRKAVVEANDALINNLHREQTARREIENDLTQRKIAGVLIETELTRSYHNAAHVALSFLRGDLSYDRVAAAKKVLQQAIKSSSCSTCGCDCPGCGCGSGCCTKCGCCSSFSA